MAADLSELLIDALRAKTGVTTLDYCSPPERLTGGFWAELLAFTLRDAPPGWDGPLVARVMPDAAVARKETVVQAAAAAAGVPTPLVRGAGGPDDGLGRAFMVMDRAAGKPLLAGLDRPAALVSAPATVWRMPDVLAAAMAQLHAVDPAAVREELAGVAGVATTLVDFLELLHSRAAAHERADLVAAAEWLVAHQPMFGDEVICHGDLHPFNVLVDADGHATVLDWSASLLAPRAYDIAFTTLLLGAPPLAVPAIARRPLRAAGRALAGRFVRRYRAHTGVVPDAAAVRWCQAVVCLRALTEVAGWVSDGTVEDHREHPWLVSGPAFAAHLADVSGVAIRAR